MHKCITVACTVTNFYNYYGTVSVSKVIHSRGGLVARQAVTTKHPGSIPRGGIFFIFVIFHFFIAAAMELQWGLPPRPSFL